MTVFDELCEADGDDEWAAWLRRVIENKQKIVDFTCSRLGKKGHGEFVRFVKGSFNLSLCITFRQGEPDVLIRFPKPGHTATLLRDEKVANEVNVLEFIRQRTTIPVPHVLDWGLAKEGPQDLGPFIIMEFIRGDCLASMIQQPTEDDQEDVILNPDVNLKTLDVLYDQMADYMIQLSELDFDAIGSISHNHLSDTWSVNERPFTYNMNELTTVSGYPQSAFPVKPFQSAYKYLQAVADEHLVHFKTQRNLANSPEDVQRRFIARKQFKKLIDKYAMEDTGPFKIFCDDLQPTNMLVDPQSLQITAVLDWEFTHTMPAQFAYDPPWWLLLLGPDMYLEKYSMKEFLERYEPRMEQFVQAVERVEAKRERNGTKRSQTHLSALMRDAWHTKRFWFDYGIRKSFDIDAVYWVALHEGSADDNPLDEEANAELETLKKMKMEQLREYDQECRVRFG